MLESAMPNIVVPARYQGNPIEYTGDCTPQFAATGSAFSKDAYQHSKLSLREFEGARMRTTEINGCFAGQSMRESRDVGAYADSLGGDARPSVFARGPAPDEAFHAAVSPWRRSPLFSERERMRL